MFMDNNKQINTNGGEAPKNLTATDVVVSPVGHSSEAKTEISSAPVGATTMAHRTDAPLNIPVSAGTASVVGETGAIPKASGAAVGAASVAHRVISNPEKPLSKNQRKRLRKAARDIQWQESASKSEPTNRERPHDLATSSLIDETPVKRPRIDPASRSYSQAVSGIKMAVVRSSGEGSSVKLRAENVNHIRQAIDNAIDDIPPGGEGPQILSSSLLDGVLIFNCSNASTVEWLRLFFAGERWTGMGYIFLPASNLPKPVKIAFKSKDIYTQDGQKLLHRLELLNPGLSTRKWRVRDKSVVCAQYARWIFEIDPESAQIIRANNFELYAGSHGKGLVKILHDPQAQREKMDNPPAGTSASFEAEGAAVSIGD